PRQLPRQDGSRRGGLERTPAPLALGPRDQLIRARRRTRSAYADGPGGGRNGGAPGRRLAAPQSHGELVQAARARLVRAGQRQLGNREPLGGAAGHLVVRTARALPDRVPAPRRGRESLPRPRRARSGRRGRAPPRSGTTSTCRWRRLCAGGSAGLARLAGERARRLPCRRRAPRSSGGTLQRLLRRLARVGTQGLARGRLGLGARTVREGRLAPRWPQEKSGRSAE